MAKSLKHPTTPYGVGSSYMGKKKARKPTRGTHHAAETGTPPKARPKAGLLPSAARIDAKFGAATAGPNTIGGPVSAARGAPKTAAGSSMPASKSRSAAGIPFTDRAKVAEAPKKTRAAAKSSPAKAAATTASSSSPAAAKKGGLMGLLAGNVGRNEELAKKRMLAASRKG